MFLFAIGVCGFYSFSFLCCAHLEGEDVQNRSGFCRGRRVPNCFQSVFWQMRSFVGVFE